MNYVHQQRSSSNPRSTALLQILEVVLRDWKTFTNPRYPNLENLQINDIYAAFSAYSEREACVSTCLFKVRYKSHISPYS